MRQMLLGVDIEMLKKLKIPQIPSVLIWCIVPVIVFWMSETYTHTVSEDMGWRLILFNLLFYYLVYGIILCIFRRSSVSIVLGTAIWMILGLTNYYVTLFRSVPVYPWDILSIKTAANVAGNYTYKLGGEPLYLTWGFVCLMIVGLFTGWQITFKQKQYRILASSCGIILFVSVACASQMTSVHEALGYYEYLFTPNVFYHHNGLIVSLMSNMQYMNVAAPSGYSAGHTQEIFSAYESDEDVQQVSVKPNIIAIMNEAFSDPSVLGELDVNMDYMPFIRSLQKNTIKGMGAVSVKGGNTANSEFEFLTGNSMAFLPSGSIPYQQYIHQPMPTMINQLNQLGYSTWAMHPYRSNGWNRRNVYKNLGFQHSLFEGDFYKAEILREYVTDRATYDKIIEIYENKREDQPVFVFDVTMQNHSSYSREYDNFVPDVEVTGEDDKLLERYLSLIKVSDEAFKELVAYFEQVDEPTIIIMFGDHQPADWVVSPILENAGITDQSLWSESFKRYQVPVVIWANYDIEEQTFAYPVSLNYLGAFVCRTAGLPLTPYQSYLMDLMEKWPAVTATVYEDAKGNVNGMSSGVVLPSDLQDYAGICYNHLFDIDNRNDDDYE